MVNNQPHHFKHSICDSKRHLQRQWKNYYVPESAQDRRTSSEILMIIETMVTPTMVMEGMSLRNMMKKGEDQAHHGHGDRGLDGESNRSRHCSVDVLDNQSSGQKKR